MASVTVDHIVKMYDTKKNLITALRDVSFRVEKGELFGIIGPDGAGKTSLFRILTTLLLPDKGSATVDGFDVVKDYKNIRNRVGYMPGRFSLYQDLTVEENLSFFATIFNTTIHQNYEMVKEIYSQIEPFKNRRAGKLSGGMKQKLALSCALIHKPSVLFLDEPTTGVDAVSRKEFWDMLKKLQQQGITILVSTPYMDEAELCDRVALIQNGEIMKVHTPTAIIDQFGKKIWAVKADNMSGLLHFWLAQPGTESCYAFGEYLHLIMKDDHYNTEKLEQVMKQQDFKNIQVHKAKPNIEDCFMALMRRKE
ncbi:MAG: ABC transporter ATP-binding protein [Ilyomonas sp.]